MSSRILAIETSTSQGNIAFLVDGEVKFEKRFFSQRSHNSQIFEPLREALEVAESNIDTILVGTGPGSYTGVRIGISVAQGLAMSLGAKVYGISSAMGVDSLDVKFCGDARRGHYYLVALGKEGWPDKVELLSVDQFSELLQTRKEGDCITFDRSAPLQSEKIQVREPSAKLLAKRFLAGEGKPVEDLETRPLEPIYLSEAFITQSTRKVRTIQA